MLWVLERDGSFEQKLHMINMMDKKIIAILRIFLLNWPYHSSLRKDTFSEYRNLVNWPFVGFVTN